MQPLYTPEEFQSAKSRQFLPLRCTHCARIFHRTKHDIQQLYNPFQKATWEFCSISCKAKHSSPIQQVVCEQCNMSFSKHLCQIKKSAHNFCSSSCACTYHNAHKTTGTRVSKLEKWLAVKLPELYPSIEFHFNRTDAINGELDIYIPSLRLAFELNGIFHYEPIYGPEKLSKMQTNDHRKMLACAERNIELCIIDVSHQKYFKEQSSMKFLSIIQTIIASKLSGSSPVAFTTA